METDEGRPSQAARCEKHGLALGPKGICVLCRKELSAINPGFSLKRLLFHGLWIGAAVVLLVFFLGSEDEVESETPSTFKVKRRPNSEANREQIAKRPQRENIRRDEPSREDRPGERFSPADLPPSTPEQAQIEVKEEKRGPDKYEIASARRRVDVTVYITEWCPHCRKALAYMDEKSISYREYDVEKSDSAKEERDELNPRKSVPTFKVDDIVLVGFGPNSLERAIDQAARKRLED